jgi:hypothetical protein
MQRIAAFWNRGWLGKAIVGGVGLLAVCCAGLVIIGRNAPARPVASVATSAPLATPVPAAPTEPPAPTAAPRPTRTPIPTRTPKPTETLVPTFTPEPTLTPNPNINHAGVAPLTKNDCPPDYLIKGNISSNGKIYHEPGDRSYKATNPERCFASTADAEAAGFRRSGN